MDKIFIIFFLSLILSPLSSEEISGSSRIIDGDTIYIKNYKIRLEGIDAPEMKQKCKKQYLTISSIVGFSFKKNYFCGAISKKKLEVKINEAEIKCVLHSKDRYKRYLATCYKDNLNLNKWMVRQGYAVAYRRYSKEYSNDEEYAKENKLGMWKGTFLRPEKWRKLN